MASRWSIAGLGVFVLASCSAQTNLNRRAAASGDSRSASSARSASTDESSPPTRGSSPKAESGQRRSNDLASPELDERFAVTRQVTALERAIELYGMFIERAGDDPQYAEAVRRSQNRMEDARLTICFLLEKPCDEAENR
jgi:hypothetical protein